MVSKIQHQAAQWTWQRQVRHAWTSRRSPRPELISAAKMAYRASNSGEYLFREVERLGRFLFGKAILFAYIRSHSISFPIRKNTPHHTKATLSKQKLVEDEKMAVN